MTVTEAEWALDRIQANWPGGYPAEGVWRINEDEPEILDGPRAGERAQSVDLSNAAVIAASTGDQTRDPTGLAFRYDVETVVDVRVEAVHAAEFGTVTSAAEFAGLVRAVRAAINQAQAYPAPSFPESHPQPPVYHTALVEDSSAALSTPNESDYYREDITLRLLGKEPTVEET